MPKDEISIPPILKIERGVTANIGEYLKDAGFTQVVILFGNRFTDMFDKTVDRRLFIGEGSKESE